MANTNISPPLKQKPLKQYKIRNGKRLKAIYFPQSLPPTTEKEGESMLGLTSGKLILQDGCLRVKEGTLNRLIIWPGWLTFSVEDNIIVLNYPPRWHKPAERLKIGDTIFMAGGYMQDRPDPRFLAQPIPDKCQGGALLECG